MPGISDAEVEEYRLVEMLAAVWNSYLELPVEHPQDQPEFCVMIHACQEKILARKARRDLKAWLKER